MIWPIAEVILVMGPVACFGAQNYYKDVELYFDNHPYISFTCVSWFIPGAVLRNGIKKRNKFKPKDIVEGMQDPSLALFRSIDNVVGLKSNRFAEALEKIADEDCPTQASAIFTEITQPSKQIAELVSSVYGFWTLLANNLDVSFRVALAEMGEKHIEKFVCFNPLDKPSRGDISDYQHDECGFSRAKARNELIIVPNIAKNLKKNARRKRNYVKIKKGGSENTGSMVVYPIHHHGKNEVVYCLSVFCTKANYFDEDKRSSYNMIFEKYAKRIVLEHSLILLKDKTNG